MRSASWRSPRARTPRCSRNRRRGSRSRSSSRGSGRGRRRSRGARDPRRRRPRRHRDRRRRQPPAGARRPRAPARSWPRPTRRPWSPAATSSCPRRAGWPPRPPRPTPATRSRARSPGSARSTRSTRRSGSASSASAWPTSPALVLTASGGPFLDATAGGTRRGHAASGAATPHLDDGSQDHHRLGDARQQGPGGHRGPLAVRCRGRRHRGRHPPPECRPLGRPLPRRLAQGPAGHPGHATSHPVRAHLSRTPPVAGRGGRPDRHRPPRLPGARRGPLPGPAHRARGRTARAARLGRPDRGR